MTTRAQWLAQQRQVNVSIERLSALMDQSLSVIEHTFSVHVQRSPEENAMLIERVQTLRKAMVQTAELMKMLNARPDFDAPEPRVAMKAESTYGSGHPSKHTMDLRPSRPGKQIIFAEVECTSAVCTASGVPGVITLTDREPEYVRVGNALVARWMNVPCSRCEATYTIEHEILAPMFTRKDYDERATIVVHERNTSLAIHAEHPTDTTMSLCEMHNVYHVQTFPGPDIGSLHPPELQNMSLGQPRVINDWLLVTCRVCRDHIRATLHNTPRARVQV